jgi:lipoprotein NlpD
LLYSLHAAGISHKILSMRHNHLFLFLFTFLLFACSSPYQAPVGDAGDGPLYLDSGRTHLVNDGETLYAIAWMYDLDFSALARVNNLAEPYSVTPGQVLTVDLRGQPASPAVPASSVVSRGATVTTSAVQTAGAIQRAPLPSSGITRRELPSARSTTPAPPVEPPTTSTVPAEIPATSLPPVTVPVTPPVATIETPRTLPEPSDLPDQTAPPVQSEPPVQPLPTVEALPSVQPPVVVAPPASTPSSPAITAGDDIDWDWPFRGAIIGRFGDAGVENKGLDLAGNKGDSILAAADGEVVYSGSGLLRYGDLIIIKHNEHFLSAYAHNSALNVREGDKVTQGQKIAELGSSGINRNMLHFEIRLDGKPVDPQLYLPAP